MKAEAGKKEKEEEESRDVQLDAGFLSSPQHLIVRKESYFFYMQFL